MVQRYIRPPRLQPTPRGRTPPHPTGHPRQHRPHALRPGRLPAQTSKTSPTQGQVFSFLVPTEHCDCASDPRIAAQQRYGLMALLRPKRPARPGMREILLLCSANPAQCRMIRCRRPAMTSMLCSRRARMEEIRRVQECAAARDATMRLTPVIPTPKEIAWLPFRYF
jgi:hypothetical protein